MAGNNEKELKLIISAYDKGLKAGLKEATAGLKKTGTEAAKSQKKFKSFRSETSQLTGQLKNLVGAYVGFRTVEGVVGTISDFNTEMAKTSTMADTASDAWAGLSDQIIEISTRVPQTAAELAKAEYDILSANVALEDSAKVLELSAKAAVAGVTDTQTAVKVGTSVINAYGLDIEKLDGVYDDLFTTVKLGKTEFPLLAAALGKVLPTARAAKVDLKELGAHLATLTQGGLSTAEATTALRGTMIALQTPTEAAKKKMAALGIEWNGLTGTIKQIVDLNLGAEVMREIIPETEARTAVFTLAQNFGILEENLEKMKVTGGAADAAYAKMADTLENKFKLIKNALTAAIIDNDKFKQSLDDLLVAADQGKEGLAALATVVLDLSAKLVNGAASIGTFIDATNQLLEQTYLQLEAQGQEVEVLDGLAARIAAANEATGLQISTSKELVELIKAGVIVFDELGGKVLVNAENLKLYNQGLLLIGPAVDLAAGSQAELWNQAGKVNATLEQQKSDMAGVGDEIVKIKAAEDALITTTGDLNQKQKTSVERLQSLIEAYKKLGAAYAGTGDEAKEAGDKAKASGEKFIEAGRKGNEGAKIGEKGWRAFAKLVGVSVDQLKAAIAGITTDLASASAQVVSLAEKAAHAGDWLWDKKNQKDRTGRTVGHTYDSMTMEQLLLAEADIKQRLRGGQGSAEDRDALNSIVAAMGRLNNYSDDQIAALQENTQAMVQLGSSLRMFPSGYGMSSSSPFKFSTGGRVPGSGLGDTVPAWVTPGEFIIRKSVVSALGADFFAALNGGFKIPEINFPVQKFATGGIVREAAKTVNLNFNIGGRQVTGAFDQNGAAILVAELKRAQMVAL